MLIFKLIIINHLIILFVINCIVKVLIFYMKNNLIVRVVFDLLNNHEDNH